MLTLLFLTGLFEDLPEATLAAVVIAAVIELVDIGALATLYRVYTRALGRVYGARGATGLHRRDRRDARRLRIFDTLPGLFIGIAISLLLLVYRASRPHIAVLGTVGASSGGSAVWVDLARHPEAHSPPGVLVVRVEGQLFFANCDAVRLAVSARAADSHFVVIDLESTAVIDVSAAHSLIQLREDLQAQGKAFAFSGEIGQVRDVMRTVAGDRPEMTTQFSNLDEAVASLREPSGD